MRRVWIHGFTLFEMVIVLTIISILAAILTPTLTTYIERAKYDAARSDVKMIASAVVAYNADTKMWPIYRTAADIPDGNAFNLLRGPGDQPGVAASAIDWPIILAAVNGTTSLDGMLNTNYYLLLTVGQVAWKGAYLELAADPWGTSYYLTAAHLRPHSTLAAYVISAGPNQTIDTLYAQPQRGPLVVGGDDIVQRIR